MAFADDIERADRAVQAHLGSVPVVYQPLVGDAVTIQGMYDANYVLIEQGNAGVEQVVPSLWLMLDDLPGNPEDDDPVVTVYPNGLTQPGIRYTARERQVDSVVGDSIRLVLLLDP